MKSELVRSMEYFLKGYLKLIEVGRQKGKSDEKIERVQRAYVMTFMMCILKNSAIPKNLQLEMLDKVKVMIQKKEND